MTREEASFILANIDRRVCDDDLSEALDMAIEALEQEPCEDAISRQAVDDAICEYSRSCDVNYGQIMEYIEKLPSVTPKQRTGHWIENTYELSREFWDSTTECSVCGYKLGGAMPNFCPNCGAKMAESED